MQPLQVEEISTLEVGRCIDVAWGMIALECALERRPCTASDRRSSVEPADLALAFGSVVVAHEAVVLLISLLAAPNSPGE